MKLEYWQHRIVPVLLYLCALYCVLAAMVLGALAWTGQLPHHDFGQITPLLIQLAANGVALAVYGASRATRPRWSWSALPTAAAGLLASGLSGAGLLLVIDVALNLTATNAVALLLIIPGLYVFLPLSSETAKVYPGPESMEDSPLLSSGDIAWLVVLRTLYYTVFFAMLFGGLALIFGWYAILKQSLFYEAHVSLMAAGKFVLHGEISLWPMAAGFVVIGFILAIYEYAGVLRRIWQEGKARAGFSSLSPEQRASIQDRLYDIWDYANRPGFEKPSVWAILLPLLAVLLPPGLAFALMMKFDAIAASLNPVVPAFAHAGTFLLVRDSALWVVPLILSMFIGVGLDRFIINHWPTSLQYQLVHKLRRGETFDLGTVGGLRRALERQARGGVSLRAGQFDPHGFLLSLWRRSSRTIYAVAILSMLLSAVAIWRTAAAYTYVSDEGIKNAGVFDFSGPIHYSFRDVASVSIICRSKKISYEMNLRDGSSTELLYEKELPAAIPALQHIDSRLRHDAARFETDPSGPGATARIRRCVDGLAKDYGSKEALAQIMHVN